ncbi:MAG: hypothetical protein IBJ04_09505 [Hydrogenophaga sp.]|uniref:hypothetical protein n=1 Tax=Hydrogenophaga sp. TaxID=1904254 RepID=UPI00257FB3E0|nr:hypothetical protein [Hydrogenophaga sp.]MBL0944547.1 hypothetical protein [Hydrogenophaga sp.]
MTRKDKEERGLAGAISRGRTAREAWVRDGILVSREQFAERWGVSVEEIAQMVAKGELFELEVLGRLWLPAVFLEVPREAVIKVNRTMAEAGVDASGALVLWHQKHGALGGLTLVQELVRSGSLDINAILGERATRGKGLRLPLNIRTRSVLHR